MATITKKKRVAKKQVIVIPMKYVEAVELGALWLDVTFGHKEWLKRIDMSLFDITDPETCVAGNVFKDSKFFNSPEGNDDNYEGYEQFREVMRKLNNKDDLGVKFGFYAESDRGMAFLQDLWVRKIAYLKKQRHIR